MGDVGEGPSMNEGGSSLQGLHQIGLQGVFQQGRHGSFGLEVMGGDRPVVIGVGHNDSAKAFLQVGDTVSQAENRHNLRGHGDFKAVFTGDALHPSSQAVHDVAELAVVHIHAAFPDNFLSVDSQGVALLNMIVQHSGQEIVGRSNGVEIPGEVEIDVLHGNDLGVSTPGRAALYAEDRSQGGLPQGHQGVLSQAAESVGQSHGGGGLSFSCGSGGNGGDQNQLAVGTVLQFPQKAAVHLRFAGSVLLKGIRFNAAGSGNLSNRTCLGALGDFNIRSMFHMHSLTKVHLSSLASYSAKSSWKGAISPMT